MSTEDDRIVLSEYQEWCDRWQEEHAMTIDAFLAEREAVFNVRRIKDALAVVDGVLDRYIVSTIAASDPGTRALHVALDTVRDKLIDDRPYVDTRRLGDAHPTREFT